MCGTGEPAHVDANLADQRRRGWGADPLNRLQESARFVIGLQIHRDLLLDLEEFVVHPVDVLEDLAQEEAMMRANPPLERLAQVRRKSGMRRRMRPRACSAICAASCSPAFASIR